MHTHMARMSNGTRIHSYLAGHDHEKFTSGDIITNYAAVNIYTIQTGMFMYYHIFELKQSCKVQPDHDVHHTCLLLLRTDLWMMMLNTLDFCAALLDLNRLTCLHLGQHSLQQRHWLLLHLCCHPWLLQLHCCCPCQRPLAHQNLHIKPSNIANYRQWLIIICQTQQHKPFFLAAFFGLPFVFFHILRILLLTILSGTKLKFDTLLFKYSLMSLMTCKLSLIPVNHHKQLLQ